MSFAKIAAVALSLVLPGTAMAQVVGLGLTHHQLEDADLLDARGREIGEVERVVLAADGTASGLIIEIDQRDPTPDRLVEIPLAGLKAVPERGDPGDFNVQTSRTVADLLALPVATLR